MSTKTRTDTASHHRHHAVDALVIACTNQGLVQRISMESQFNHQGRQRVPDIGLPWHEFRTDAAEQLNGLLVSYKGGKRLLSSRTNRYVHSKAHKGKPEKHQRTRAIRGPLQEETLYGRITITGKGTKEETYVVRKALTALTDAKQLDAVVDPVVRETLKDHVAAHGGKLKEAMKHPVYMPVKEGKEGLLVPIKRVRLRVSTHEMVEVRPDTYVEPGSNFCIAIYEDGKGKRAFRTVSFFEASQRALSKEALYPAEVDGKPLLMVLQQRDLVVLYDNHPDGIQWDSPNWLAEQVYMVRKFDRNGKVGLVRHSAANVDLNKPNAYPDGTMYVRRVGSLPAVKVRINELGVIAKA